MENGGAVELRSVQRRGGRDVDDGLGPGSPEPDHGGDTSKLMHSSTAENEDRKKVSVKKEVTLLHAVGFVIGDIIGSGIFITTTFILGYSGSMGLTLILWVVGGFISMAGGLCYCELGTFLPQSGGDYTYIKEAYSFKNRWKWSTFLGSLLGFLFSWSSIFVIFGFGTSPIILAFGEYVIRPFFVDCDVPDLVVRLIAVAATISLGLLNCFSMKWSSRMMAVLSIFKVFACCFIVILAVWQLASGGCIATNYRRPFDGTTTSPSGIALGLYKVLFAYSGWNILNMGAEEVKNVEKTLPRAVFIGVPVVAVCYILVNLSYFVVLTYPEILFSESVGLSVGHDVLGSGGVVVVSLLVASSTFGSTNAGLFKSSRVMFASARDGRFPGMFSGLHKSARTPVPSVVAMTMVISLGVLVGDIENLIDAFSAATWVFYGLSFLGLIIMRFTHKKKRRPYKVWVGIPVVMVFVSLYLVVVPLYQKPVPSLIAFATILSGVPVYVFLVMEKPWRLRPKVFDRISCYLARITESLCNTLSSRNDTDCSSE